MTKDIAPLNRDVPEFGRMSFNGNEVIHYMDIIDLPDGQAGQACSDHITDGAASELLGEFMLTGCESPKPDDEQMIRTAFVCPGPSILKKCRLKLMQADAEGKIMNEGKFVR